MSATNSPRGWPTDEQSADPQTVLAALEDDACREILEATKAESLTATEVSEQCEIPMSTAYRKVELLADAMLVEEQVRINTSGKHATEYRTCFDDVVISVDSGEIEVELITADSAGAASPSYAAADD